MRAFDAILAVCEATGLDLIQEPDRLLVKVPEDYTTGSLVIPTEDAEDGTPEDEGDAAQALPGEEVVLQDTSWVNASLPEMLVAIQEQSGLTISLEAPVTNTLDMDWEEITAGDALMALAQALDLDLVREDGVIVLRAKTAVEPEEGAMPEDGEGDPEAGDPAGDTETPEGADPSDPNGADNPDENTEDDPAPME